MLDIPTPTTHTLLTTLERDLLTLNQKLSQRLIHTILLTMDMLDMVVDISVIHMGLTTLERDLPMLNQKLIQRLIHTM